MLFIAHQGITFNNTHWLSNMIGVLGEAYHCSSFIAKLELRKHLTYNIGPITQGLFLHPSFLILMPVSRMLYSQPTGQATVYTECSGSPCSIIIIWYIYTKTTTMLLKFAFIFTKPFKENKLKILQSLRSIFLRVILCKHCSGERFVNNLFIFYRTRPAWEREKTACGNH